MGFFDAIGDIFESDDAKTETTSKSGYSPEVAAAGKTALERATTSSEKSFTPYDPRERVAPLVPSYDDAFGLIRGNVGKYKPDIGTSKGVARGYATGDTGIYDRIDAFKNPYLEDVLGRTTENINRSYDIADRRNTQSLKAAAGTASTNSGRLGLREAQMQKDRAAAIADAVAKISAQGYDTAAGMSAADAQARMSGANQLANLLTTELNMDQADINRMLQMAGTEQGRADMLSEAKWQEFLRAQGWDDNRINNFINQLGAIAPLLGTTGTQVATADPGGNDLMRWLGLGISAVGALSGGGGTNPGNPPVTYAPAGNYLPPVASYEIPKLQPITVG